MAIIRAAHNYTTRDAVYIVGIVLTPDKPDIGKYSIIARWGRRGRGSQLPLTNSKIYHHTETLSRAEAYVDSVIGKKFGRDYIDVESAGYAPTKGYYSIEIAKKQFGYDLIDVNDTKHIVQQLTEEVPTEVCQKNDKFDIPEGVEVLVFCIDPLGESFEGVDVRDGYDKDDEYVATMSPLGNKYIRVFDRYGNLRSVPQNQFKFAGEIV